MTTDLDLGPLRVRLELVPILAGVALASSPELALALLVVLAVHELGHYAAARSLGAPVQQVQAERAASQGLAKAGGRVHPGRGPQVVLQLGGGGSYLRELETPRGRVLVLAAGSVFGLGLLLAALTLRAYAGVGLLGRFSAELVYASIVWTGFQLFPFPPLDGGLLLRALVERRLRATTLWRIQWALGLALGAGLVIWDLHLLQPVVLLGGMALVLGRAESGYVRHLDAYDAWERKDYREVVERVRRLPEYLDKHDRLALLELGTFAAMELGSREAVEDVASQLPAHRPVAMKAAEWLLGRGHGLGARLAQHALDALDADLVRAEGELGERFVDLSFAYARYEARVGQVESALGLLERAVQLGYRDLDRLELDGDLKLLHANPRWARVCARLSS